MKVLLSGATGFLGRFLVKKLQGLGHEVVGFGSKECDLTKEESLLRYKKTRFTHIYHLAAWTQAGDFCLRHPGEQWLINQKINTHMLSFWKECQPQAKLICMGTSCSYAADEPLIEENYLKGTPIESLYTYAMTKRMLLVGLQSLHKQFGLNYLYVIPSTLYGPGYHTDGRQMHFIFDLMRKIVDKKRGGSPIILWGDGKQKRELIHVEDFVEALIFLASQQKNQHINVGGGKEHSIHEFATLLCSQIGVDPSTIQYDTNRYTGAKSKVLNIEKLQRLMPTFSPRALDEGLAETLSWYQTIEVGPG